MKSNSKGVVGGFLAALRLIEKCKKGAFEIAQIYGATAYLKGVHIARDFFLYQTGVLACVMFLAFGIILMEVAVIFFIPMDISRRCIVAFLLGAINVLTAAVFLRRYTSSGQWLHLASKYNAWIKTSLEEEVFSSQ